MGGERAQALPAQTAEVLELDHRADEALDDADIAGRAGGKRCRDLLVAVEGAAVAVSSRAIS